MRIPDIKNFSRRRPPKVRDQRQKDLDQVYTDARKLSQQLSMLRDTAGSGIAPLLAEAEGLTIKMTDLIYDAWTKGQI